MKRSKAIAAQVKFQIALEALRGEKSAVEIARAYGLHPNTVYKYRDELMAKGASLFAGEGQEREYEKKIRELEQLLGKKEVEIALLKNFLRQGR